jgi:hypothetical protein
MSVLTLIFSVIETPVKQGIDVEYYVAPNGIPVSLWIAI